MTKKQTPQSLDGVLRPQHRVNFERTARADASQRFISVRPRVVQRPLSGSIEGIVVKPRVPMRQGEVRRPGWAREAAPTVSPVTLALPAATPLKDRDVVVRLPRRWSLRIGLVTLLQYAALAVIAVASAYSTAIGQWFVLVYALYALLTRQDSRVSFGIALFVLVSVPFFQVINQPGVANNMAVYVYELLVVGTVQALIELRRPSRTATNE